MALDTTVKTVHTIEKEEIVRGPLNEYTYKVQFIERIDVNVFGKQRMNVRACDITLQWVRWNFFIDDVRCVNG